MTASARAAGRGIGAALACVGATAGAIPLRWPVAPGPAVSAYVDHDHGPGVLDWRCGDLTYDGHRGVDLGVAPGVEVVAAAEGVVDHRADGFGDGCLGCWTGDGFGNHVELLHADGTATIYAHLSAGTGLPALGARVACGARVGASGASGNVTGPHVHFELREDVRAGEFYSGRHRDPFAGRCSERAGSSWLDQRDGTPTARCATPPEDAAVADAARPGDATVASDAAGAGCGCRAGWGGGDGVLALLALALAARRRGGGVRALAVAACAGLAGGPSARGSTPSVWFVEDAVLYRASARDGAADARPVALPGRVARALTVDDGAAALALVCPRDAPRDGLPAGCVLYRVDDAAVAVAGPGVVTFDAAPDGALAYTTHDGRLVVRSRGRASVLAERALWVRFDGVGRRVAYLDFGPAGASFARPGAAPAVVVRALDDGAARMLRGASGASPVLTASGASVLFLAAPAGRAVVLRAAAGEPARTTPAPPWTQDVLALPGERLLYASQRDGATALVSLDVDTGAVAVTPGLAAPQRVLGGVFAVEQATRRVRRVVENAVQAPQWRRDVPPSRR